MPYQQDLLDELNLLLKFNLETTMEGIKIHSTAQPAVISAAQRLFDKGMISQSDGGYLTDLGHEAAEHAQSLLIMMSQPSELATKHTTITS
ncbi:MAG: TIGR02647 family protein [Gammaproteobacteria bacterium]|nr:TIGR02647 family protein [Gammaproteobacteria bacterium]